MTAENKTMDPVRVGLLGLGTVGGGTVRLLTGNAEEIERRSGRSIVISQAAARQYDESIPGLAHIGEIGADAFAVVENPEIEIIVELIGGYSPALELVLQAIAKGKHVVTANKALIARHGNEIFAAARAQGAMVAFEAAVAGGIPLLKALREGLAANRIEWVAGIINGTGNFILTEMQAKQRDFAKALGEAQALGYAEADPGFDVEGVDAAHKITILAALAFGIPLQLDKTYTEGISHIEQQDVIYAAELGYRIKHLGIARKAKKGIELRVHPALIPERRLLANVDGVMNAVLVKGDAAGPTLYYGAGAGALPTASAVAADVIELARALTSAPENRAPPLGFQADAIADTAIVSMDEVETAYYLRIHALDKPGVLAAITNILGRQGISIEAIIQKEPAAGAAHVPVIFLTQRIAEKNMNRAMQAIEALDSIDGRVQRIRVETLDE